MAALRIRQGTRTDEKDGRDTRRTKRKSMKKGACILGLALSLMAGAACAQTASQELRNAIEQARDVLANGAEAGKGATQTALKALVEAVAAWESENEERWIRAAEVMEGLEKRIGDYVGKCRSATVSPCGVGAARS